jgi:hypothetical protein
MTKREVLPVGARSILITGHVFSVCQTAGPVGDWGEAESCLNGSLVATLRYSGV